jgi:hypothetical protein
MDATASNGESPARPKVVSGTKAGGWLRELLCVGKIHLGRSYCRSPELTLPFVDLPEANDRRAVGASHHAAAFRMLVRALGAGLRGEHTNRGKRETGS